MKKEYIEHYSRCLNSDASIHDAQRLRCWV